MIDPATPPSTRARAADSVLDHYRYSRITLSRPRKRVEPRVHVFQPSGREPLFGNVIPFLINAKRSLVRLAEQWMLSEHKYLIEKWTCRRCPLGLATSYRSRLTEVVEHLVGGVGAPV
jgi:hypothetical protein